MHFDVHTRDLMFPLGFDVNCYTCALTLIHKTPLPHKTDNSYDYDSPISEAGDITTKYVAIAKAVRQFRGLPPITFPKNTTKHAYGKVRLFRVFLVPGSIGVSCM